MALMVPVAGLSRNAPRSRHSSKANLLLSQQHAGKYAFRSIASVKSRQRLHTIVSATSKDEPLNNDDVDIDQLARMLSQEADRLRRSFSEDELAETDLAEPDRTQQPSSGEASSRGVLGAFGLESMAVEEQVFAEVGDGGFSPDEFVVVRTLGQLSVQQDSGDDSDVLRGRTGPRQTAMIAYAAQYNSGLPYQGPVTVLLKEFLPGVKAAAFNELQILKHLCGIPGNKWKAAAADLCEVPPIVPLLGYFTAAMTATAAALSVDEGDDVAGMDSESLWLVYKWEGMRPLSGYAAASQDTQRRPIPFLFNSNAPASAVEARHRMLRTMMRKAVAALKHCHERGVVHGSVSAGALMLSTYDDWSYDALIVKLDNFGFARRFYNHDTAAASSSSGPSSTGVPIPDPVSAETPFALGCQQDLQALGVVLADLVFAALSGLADDSTSSLQRLIVDVFERDISRFREYCDHEPQWSNAVEFLDEVDGGGWALLQCLISGRDPAPTILDMPFLAA